MAPVLLTTYSPTHTSAQLAAVERVLREGAQLGHTGPWDGSTVLLAEARGRITTLGQGATIRASWHPDESPERVTGRVVARLDRVAARELQGALIVGAVGFTTIYWKEAR